MARQLPPVAVSGLTGFATQTLANWRTLEIGPAFYKIGRSVRYDEDVLEAWLATQRSPATAS